MSGQSLVERIRFLGGYTSSEKAHERIGAILSDVRELERALRELADNADWVASAVNTSMMDTSIETARSILTKCAGSAEEAT